METLKKRELTDDEVSDKRTWFTEIQEREEAEFREQLERRSGLAPGPQRSTLLRPSRRSERVSVRQFRSRLARMHCGAKGYLPPSLSEVGTVLVERSFTKSIT